MNHPAAPLSETQGKPSCRVRKHPATQGLLLLRLQTAIRLWQNDHVFEKNAIFATSGLGLAETTTASPPESPHGCCAGIVNSDERTRPLAWQSKLHHDAVRFIAIHSAKGEHEGKHAPLATGVKSRIFNSLAG